MPSHFFKSSGINSATFFAALLLCLLASAACGNSSSQVASSQTAQNANTPSGERAPRSAYPMPPVSTDQTAKSLGWTLLDNRRMKMSDYEGKVVVLDFWATYCPPCREEIPQLVELQRRYGPQGFQIIGLNVGGPEDRAKVPEFVRTYRIQYTLAYPDPELVNLYLGNNDVIPQTLVFDRKGRLVKHFISYDSAIHAELERAVQEALEQG